MTVSTASRIRRLPPALADAIAAGEVIERPASVVKELGENALDAGASRIDIEIEGGGLARIVVADNGCGIVAEELELAVSRHATSKVETHRDLERIMTLGFRGEALASIASVSDLRVTSRVPSAASGATIRVRSGDVVESSAAGVAAGTCVEVLELFAATPARLRFLRESRTEAAHATRAATELALTHPQVAFTCMTDGRTTLRTAGRSREDSLRSVFGASASGELIRVRSEGPVAVDGMISRPLVHRASRAGLVMVVNGRRVHNRSLVVAVEEAYRGLLPQNRHPFGLVEVTVDPAAVDVNVHPTKREVRFRDERQIFAAVQRACWAALAAEGVSAQPIGLHSHVYAPASAAATTSAMGFAESPTEPVGEGPVLGLEEVPAGQSTSLRAVGQVRGEWIVAEARDGVLLVDPHAAHEKVIYARLLDAWSDPERTASTSQLLLLPELIECDPTQLSRAETNAAFLTSCGFAIEAFGPGVLRCTAVPTAAAHARVETLIRDVLDALDDESVAAQRRHAIAALVACHAAVRFGDRLDIAEQQRLLEELAATPGGTTCPHGRPTMVRLDDAYLRRIFQRSAL